MAIKEVRKDPETLTMTVHVEVDAKLDRAWQLWADPRQLERWWGPPAFPATFVDHDLVPGGRVSYFMTGPDGERFPGWWQVVEVEPPRRLEVQDGFADADGEPDTTMPVTTMTVTLAERDGGGTDMVIASQFPSQEEMEKLVEMGMEEGMTAAVGQIEGILATGPAPA